MYNTLLYILLYTRILQYTGMTGDSSSDRKSPGESVLELVVLTVSSTWCK